jgi:DNA-binding transcriptional LysR family regulator
MTSKDKARGTDLGIDAPGLMATVEELLLLMEVIDASGYRAASERTGIPRSSLSRRIAALEDRLGVCLITRNSRRFEVTDMGRQLFQQGLKIREAAQAAISIAHDSGGVPSGDLRVACPMALSTILLGPMAVQFAKQHPRVRIFLSTTRGTSEALAQNFDIVIHPSSQALPDSDVVAQRLIHVPYGLFAPPQLLQGATKGSEPNELAGLDAIGWNSGETRTAWILQGPDGRSEELRLQVRFVTDNLLAVKEAAIAGLGVARLPIALAADALVTGELVQVVPKWALPTMSIYALYPSRRHLSLAGQQFLQWIKPALETLVVSSSAAGS